MAAYSLDDYTLTAPEQSVLVALAFRINPKSLKCCPAGDNLEKLTRLGHTAIRGALNGLRDKGLIDWKSGGMKNKRGKDGRLLANDYVLNLLVEKVKEEMEKKRKDRQRKDRQAAPAVAASRSSPRPLDGHCSSRQTATAVAATRSPTINMNKNKNNIEREAPKSDGNGSVYNEALKVLDLKVPKVTVPSPQAKMSPVGKALNACGVKPGTDSYQQYYKAFSREMICIGESEMTDILQTFDNDVQQGKLKDCPSLPQEFLRRVKEKSEEQHP